MSTKRSIALFFSVTVLCSVSLCFLLIGARSFSRNGAVCNYSSHNIWITVTESGRRKTYSFPPGSCTNVSTQDVEAIWGKDCNTDPCEYQAWKVAAGRFNVYDDQNLLIGAVLRIKGWGLGSRWHITRDWPKPDLATMDYSLVR